MIRSMTGYGGAKGVVEGLNVTVELKSVNLMRTSHSHLRLSV